MNTQLIKPFPHSLSTLPDGWLCQSEADLLYTATLAVAGTSVLEVGSWIGRSSCVIAEALAKLEQPTRYDIIDYGIAGLEEWESRFGTSPFLAKDADKFCKTIYHPGGAIGALKQNLVDRRLSKYVTLLICGDLLHYNTVTQYSFVFCDCTHDAAEIARNVPLIAALLSEHSILICDDIHNEESLQTIKTLATMDKVYLSNTHDVYSKFGIFTRGRFNAVFS